MRFQGKTAIVTAAGAGIGRATTDILVREGARVVAVEIDQARLDKMAEELGDAAGEVDGRCIDAMDEGQVREKRDLFDDPGRAQRRQSGCISSMRLPKGSDTYTRSKPASG